MGNCISTDWSRNLSNTVQLCSSTRVSELLASFKCPAFFNRCCCHTEEELRLYIIIFLPFVFTYCTQRDSLLFSTHLTLKSSSQKNTKSCCLCFCSKAVCYDHKPMSQGWLSHPALTKVNILHFIWPYSPALHHWAITILEQSTRDVQWGGKRTNILLVEAVFLT